MEEMKKLAPNYCVCDNCAFQLTRCVCLDEERALRLVMRWTNMSLTRSQREECIREIESVEGYSRDDCEGLSDADVARMVLNAWADYARDKGLLY